MYFKIGSHRYIESAPDGYFDSWSERVMADEITDDFYSRNEKWCEQSGGLCNRWLNKLYDKGKNAAEAARIIERTYNIYKSKIEKP